MPVRFAVSDPLPMFGHGVAEVMRSVGYDVELPDDLLAWAGDAGPHIILLTLLGPADWSLLAELRDTRPQATLIAVIDAGDVGRSVRALAAGAMGVLAREADAETVRGVLSAAAFGRSLLPHDVVRALTAPQRQQPVERPPTETEIGWIRHLSHGLTVARLAQQAGYSERMMFRVLRGLYERWGVANRTEAIVLARGKGWL